MKQLVKNLIAVKLCILALLILTGQSALAQNFVEDSFFDTDAVSVTAHSPTKISDNTASGTGTWTAHTSYAGSAMAIANDGTTSCLRNNLAGGTSVIWNSVTPPSADYDVTATCILKTSTAIYVAAACGRMNTAADTFYEARLQSSTPSFINVFLYKHVAGVVTQLGAGYSTPGAPVDGSSHTVTLSMSGTTLIAKLDGTTRVTVTDSSITAAGKVGVEMYNTEAQGTGWQIDSIAATTNATSATDFTLTGPSTVPQATATTFTLTAVGGTFSASESIALSDGGIGGTFVSTPTVFSTSDSTKTFTWTPPGGYSGAFTLSASGTGAVTVGPHTLSGSVVVVTPVTDSHIIFAPGVWAGNGGGAMQSNNITGSSTRAFANSDFAYLKLAVTGATSLSINVDTTRNAGQIAGAYPILIFVRDGTVKTQTQLTSGQSVASVSVVDTGQHEYEVFYESGGYSPDRWTNGVFGLDIIGFSTDGSFVTPTGAAKQRTKRMLVLGDSIAAGTGAGEPELIWPYLAGKILDADVGVGAFGSTSWGATANGVPGLYTSYDHIDSAHTRTFSNIDYLVVAMGTNDTSLTANNVQSWITTARTKNATMWICMVVPPGNSSNSTDYGLIKTAVTNAVSQYNTAVPSDGKVILVDGTDVLHNLFPGPAGSGTYASYDFLHPNAIGHPIYAAIVGGSIAKQVNAIATAGGKRRIQ